MISPVTAALVLALAAAPQAPANPTDPEPAAVRSGIDISAANVFVWRGFVPCDGFVVQPSVWVAAGPFTVSSWANLARRGPNGQAFTEHDLTVDITRSAGAWTWSAGWIHYAFVDLDAGRYSNEVYVGLARPGPLNPSVRLFHDPHEGSGTYLSLGLSQPITTPWPALALTATLTAGYNHRLWTDHAAWSDASFVVEATVPSGLDRLSLQPLVGYSASLDSRIAASRLLWGLGASITVR